MTRWGMVVDLGRCVGCQTCTIACKMENALPPGTLWRTVRDVESGVYPDVRRTFVPLTCMHCADPPCLGACPTTATRVRPDGIVWIDNDLCIGCGSCVVACPYEARHIIPDSRYYFDAPTAPERATYDPSRVGICTKCQFCAHKLDEAGANSVPGVHPESTPACSSSCIANAIYFGDLEDPRSNVARMLAEQGGGARMLEHLETQPSVYYLNVPPLDAQPPRLQHTWHKLAVANFVCGPMGVGLYLWSALLAWMQGPPEPLLGVDGATAWPVHLAEWPLSLPQVAGLLAPLLVIAGLLSVAAEAGRPFRGLYVFRHVRRSWASRESAFAMAFVALTGLDTLFWQSPTVQTVAIFLGAGVVFSQGMILRNAKGVPAWNAPIMPLHFLTGALCGGGGAALLLAGLLRADSPAVGLIAILSAVLADWGVWRAYLRTPPRTSTFQPAAALLRSARFRAGIEWLGHGLPIALLTVALASSGAAPGLATAAGLALVAGAVWVKGALVLKAAYLADLYDRFGERQTSASMPRGSAKAA